MLARLAEAGGMELRIFPRDGQKVGRDPKANPADEFLNERDGQTCQSIPVAAFYTEDFQYAWPTRSAP